MNKLCRVSLQDKHIRQIFWHQETGKLVMDHFPMLLFSCEIFLNPEKAGMEGPYFFSDQ